MTMELAEGNRTSETGFSQAFAVVSLCSFESPIQNHLWHSTYIKAAEI